MLVLRAVLRLLWGLLLWVVATIVRALRLRRRRLLLATWRTVVAGIVIAAAVLIDLWIVAIDVAVNNLVIYSGAIVAAGRIAGAPVATIVSRSVSGTPAVAVIHAIGPVVVGLDVVVIDVFVDGIVAINVVHVYRAIDDVSVHGDVVVAIVDINVVVVIDVAAAATDPSAIPATTAPASRTPPGVIDAAPSAAITPTEIQVQPSADGESNAKGNRGAPIRPPIINDGGVINGDVDIFRLIGRDGDVVVMINDFLLLRGSQIACIARHVAKMLNGG